MESAKIVVWEISINPADRLIIELPIKTNTMDLANEKNKNPAVSRAIPIYNNHALFPILSEIDPANNTANKPTKPAMAEISP